MEPSSGFIPALSNLSSPVSVLGQVRENERHIGKSCPGFVWKRRYRHYWMFYRRDICSGKKRGPGVGKTKRGKGTKIMAIANNAGLPIAVCTNSAETHEVKLVEKTIEHRFIKRKPKILIGDMAYDSDPLDSTLKKKNIALIAPHKSNRVKQATQDGRSLRRYRKRWKIERLFAWLQNFRKCITRFEYYEENFLGFIHLACIIMFLKYFWDDFY